MLMYFSGAYAFYVLLAWTFKLYVSCLFMISYIVLVDWILYCLCGTNDHSKFDLIEHIDGWSEINTVKLEKKKEKSIENWIDWVKKRYLVLEGHGGFANSFGHFNSNKSWKRVCGWGSATCDE